MSTLLHERPATDVPPWDTPQVSAAQQGVAQGNLSPLSGAQAHQRGALLLAFSWLGTIAVVAWIVGGIGATGARPLSLQRVPWPFTAQEAPQRSATPISRELLALRSDNRGQVLFGRYCDSCHPGGVEQTGASLRAPQFKRQFNTSEKVATFVRKGGFDMPAYGTGFLSDTDLAEIATYVVGLPELR